MNWIVERVVDAVAEATGTPVHAILSRSQRRSHAKARAIAYAAVRRATDLSWPEIGAEFKRNHTTCSTQATALADDPSSMRVLHRALASLQLHFNATHCSNGDTFDSCATTIRTEDTWQRA